MTTSDAVPDSVRLALPTEAVAIAQLQRRSWEQRLPADAAAALAAVPLDAMVEAWHRAITRPPAARFRVLVAVGEGGHPGRITGFAATVPSADGDAEPTDGEIEEFAVDPPAQGRGHGSRLLNACVDTLRADGFHRARWWLRADDDALRRFATGSGWAADGAWRELGPETGDDETGDDDQGDNDQGEDRGDDVPGDHDDVQSLRLKQVRLHTDLAVDPS